MSWNYDEAFRELVDDRVAGTDGVYGELLKRTAVDHMQVDEAPYTAVFSYDAVMKGATDVKGLSNNTQAGGPRILPLQADPPEHTAHRKAWNPYFTASVVATHEDEIRSFAASMIDAMVAKGRADCTADFAKPFPTRGLLSFLHLPDEDWPFHNGWVHEAERRTGHGLSTPKESMEEALVEVIPYLLGKVAERRAAPIEGDLISGLLEDGVGGEQLDDMAATFMFITVMLAGHITTTSAVSNLVLRLAKDPELQDRLRKDPSRIPDAIEEGLRLDTPQQAMPRRATHDLDLDGRAVREGEYVLLNFGSANVDPTHWPDAGTFDVDRRDKRHLAFGRGVHQCIGASLARLELRVAVEELLARTSSFRVAGQVRRRAWVRLAVDELPLELVPA